MDGEIKDDTKMGRYTTFLDWKNIVKITILPKAIYRLNANSLTTNGIFHRMRTKNF